jgi:hypothetical protein
MQSHRTLPVWLVLFALSLDVLAAEKDSERPEQRIRVEQTEEKLVLHARTQDSSDWHKLATYIMEPKGRPYLHPVFDPSGRHVLTQDRPDDHPWQHGIFTGFHRVNGFNYWKEDEGRQRFVRLSDLKQEPGRVSWRALIELVSPRGDVVLEEENTIAFHAPRSPDSYLIDFSLLLRAKDQDVQLGKFFVGGLSVRMPWNKENPRQTHLNSNGLRGRAGEQKRAAWCTVEQPFGEETFGFAILDHPRNANHPPSWRVDEQGLINPNVSGLNDWSIPAGQERRFEYRILVYRGPATKEKIDSEFQRFSTER